MLLLLLLLLLISLLGGVTYAWFSSNKNATIDMIDINVETFEPIFRLKEDDTKITVEDLSAGEKQIFFRGGSLLQNIKKLNNK